VWGFFVALVNPSSKSRWHANEAEVNLAIRKRTRSTADGKSPLVYFDGATMQAYQYPSKASAVVFCRTFPDAFGCHGKHGIDPSIHDVPASNLELQPSVADSGKHGVFTKVDIAEGSILAIDEQTKDIFIAPSTYELISSFTQHPAGYQHSAFSTFLNEYGCPSHYLVSPLCGLEGNGYLALASHSSDISFSGIGRCWSFHRPRDTGIY
jgi:hypothetical protein